MMNVKAIIGLFFLASIVCAQPDWENFENEVVPVFHKVLCIIYRVVWYISGPIGVLAFVWAGTKWVYAQDDAGERARAKEIMLQVVVALTLIRVAKPIAEFITQETFTCVI